MKIEHVCTIPVRRQSLWDLLMDVERVGKCFPGVEDVHANEDGTYRGTYRVRIGPVSLAFSGTMSIQVADPQNWYSSLRLEGSDRRVGGGVRADITASLIQVSPLETEIRISSDITFMGKLGEMGQSIIRKKADTMMQEFARNMGREASAPT